MAYFFPHFASNLIIFWSKLEVKMIQRGDPLFFFFILSNGKGTRGTKGTPRDAYDPYSRIAPPIPDHVQSKSADLSDKPTNTSLKKNQSRIQKRAGRRLSSQIDETKPYSKPNICSDDTEAPRKKPVFYIAKWVDFEHKYGFGYTLSEGHYGVNFNDEEKIVMNANGVNFVHIKQDLTEYHYSHQRTDEWPNHDRSAMKKITLMSHIIRYMNKQLQHAGGHRMAAGDGYARIPNLSFWKRIDTKRSSDSVRQLTNSAPHFTETPGSSKDLQNYNNNNGPNQERKRDQRHRLQKQYNHRCSKTSDHE